MNKKLLIIIGAIVAFVCVAVICIVGFVIYFANQNALVGSWKANTESSEFSQDTQITFTDKTFKYSSKYVIPASQEEATITIEGSYIIKEKKNEIYYVQTKVLKVDAASSNEGLEADAKEALLASLASKYEVAKQYSISSDGKTLTEININPNKSPKHELSSDGRSLTEVKTDEDKYFTYTKQ